MLTRDDIVKKLYEQHAYLANEYGVTKIGAFGSYAVEQATEKSDVYPVLIGGAALLGLGAIGLTVGVTLPAVLFSAILTGLGHGAMDLSGNLLIAEVFVHRRAAAVTC
jgi:hypothetical protein